jgi:hypothetical protein
MTPAAWTAAVSAAAVQLAGVPVPTVVVGALLSSGWPSAGTSQLAGGGITGPEPPFPELPPAAPLPPFDLPQPPAARSSSKSASEAASARPQSRIDRAIVRSPRRS